MIDTQNFYSVFYYPPTALALSSIDGTPSAMKFFYPAVLSIVFDENFERLIHRPPPLALPCRIPF
ncbi:MAG: hypothetical protein E7644_06045 [Ruminococcaceae bacterium]|nr:hypothetical protein [Oscillospiraceae bacterium]